MIAQYNASELLTMRESVSKEIRRVLEIRARQFNIALGKLIGIASEVYSRFCPGATKLDSGYVCVIF